jgi:hypothetical protein
MLHDSVVWTTSMSWSWHRIGVTELFLMLVTNPDAAPKILRIFLTKDSSSLCGCKNIHRQCRETPTYHYLF